MRQTFPCQLSSSYKELPVSGEAISRVHTACFGLQVLRHKSSVGLFVQTNAIVRGVNCYISPVKADTQTDQSDGNDVHSDGQDVPHIGDPDSELILLGVSLFPLKKTHRISGLSCLVSSCLPISELSKFKQSVGCHVRVWHFDSSTDC